MNVDDINEVPVDFSKRDRLGQIFDRQHSLMEKYIPIEVRNGLCLTQSCPVDLHDRFGQARLKDFFWRCTEELTEACEAAIIHNDIPSHTKEELADALHFLVEACLLADLTGDRLFFGLEPDALVELHEIQQNALHPNSTIDSLCFDVIYYLGCASNCLKNRPWKQNHQLVDTDKFYAYLREAFFRMIRVFAFVGMDADHIFNMYYRKSEVNKFRQRSNY